MMHFVIIFFFLPPPPLLKEYVNRGGNCNDKFNCSARHAHVCGEIFNTFHFARPNVVRRRSLLFGKFRHILPIRSINRRHLILELPRIGERKHSSVPKGIKEKRPREQQVNGLRALDRYIVVTLRSRIIVFWEWECNKALSEILVQLRDFQGDFVRLLIRPLGPWIAEYKRRESSSCYFLPSRFRTIAREDPLSKWIASGESPATFILYLALSRNARSSNVNRFWILCAWRAYVYGDSLYISESENITIQRR